jgi:hypothetical protein
VASLSQKIVNKYIINDMKCHKLLSKDGVTTQDFVTNKIEGLFEGISVDIKLQRSRFPSICSTSSIAKNLDEYQYIICSEVRSLPDSNSFKKELQKYRIIIMASFAKLIPILSSLDSDTDLNEWNRFAQTLLTQVSETRQKARVNQKGYEKPSSSKAFRSVFVFFGVSEEEVDKILQNIYSLGDQSNIQ